MEFKASQNQRLHTELCLLKMCALNESAFAGMPATSPLVAEKKTPVIPMPEVKTQTTSIAEITTQTIPISEEKTSASPGKIIPKPPQSAPTTVQAEQPKNNTTNEIPATRQRSSSGTISIAKTLQANKAPSTISTGTEEPLVKMNQPVNEKDLVKAVKELVEKYMSEGRRQLGVALNKHEPVLKENIRIEIPVDNPVQADEIQENKQEILFFLKEKLSNSGLELVPFVTDTDDKSGTAYTPADKFKQMAEKNPDLNQLRQQFDLELDF